MEINGLPFPFNYDWDMKKKQKKTPNEKVRAKIRIGCSCGWRKDILETDYEKEVLKHMATHNGVDWRPIN